MVKSGSSNGVLDACRDEIPGKCSSKTEVEDMRGDALYGDDGCVQLICSFLRCPWILLFG